MTGVPVLTGGETMPDVQACLRLAVSHDAQALKQQFAAQFSARLMRIRTRFSRKSAQTAACNRHHTEQAVIAGGF